ncbi:MAG: hypothetical protein ABF743_10330 [Schleiferilactobacillus perolens]|uniref:hypothetical protein n=1 Tax=Schleiferilactobacillus perolens TaxID=100468 RepID=UPI0039E78258
METSRNQRLYPKKKRRWVKILIGFLIVLVVAIGLVIAFPFQANNGLRTIMGGRDTPVDNAAKGQIIKKLDDTKNGDAVHDQIIDQAVSHLQNTSMQQVMSAANSSGAAAKLIQDNTGLSATQAQTVSKFVFEHPEFTSLRTAVANGNWLQAYQEYQNLSSDGNINQLKSDIQGQ